MPIIWWYITHCKLVEDDTQVGPPSNPFADTEALDNLERPTEISVQAFTPILGTLLLSPNGLVGGPARYAVVELLRRVHRADQSEEVGAEGSVATAPPSSGTPATTATPEVEEDLDVGLLGWSERRLLEREIVYQVVIGMGRLDIVEVMEDQQPELSQHPGSRSGSTATQRAEQERDSYFPIMTAPYVSPTADNGMIVDSRESVPDVSAAAPTFPFSVTLPSSLAHNDPASTDSGSSLISPAPHSFTPSLVSSASASSVSSSSASSLVTPQNSITPVPSDLCSSSQSHQDDSNSQSTFSGQTQSDISLGDADVEMTPADERTPSHPRFAPGVLTSLQSQPPVTFQPPSPGPAPQTQNQFEALPQSPSGQVPPLEISGQDWASADGGVGTEEDGERMDVEAEDLSEEAALGRLSSMSLMAAVTASGELFLST